MGGGGHAGFGNLQKSHDCVPSDAVFIRIGQILADFWQIVEWFARK